MRKATLFIVLIMFGCVMTSSFVAVAESESITIKGYKEQSNYIFVEKGGAFDFDALPTSIELIAEPNLNGIFVDGVPSWEVTKDNRDSILKGENFAINGTWANYVMSGQSKIAANYNNSIAKSLLGQECLTRRI